MKLKFILPLAFSALSSVLFSQIPILNSSPGISDRVIYLDFDGQVVSGTLWNNGNTINAAASTASGNSIKLIFQRVSEDYRPFNVNVTTDSVRFNNAQPNSRIRVVFTATSAWFGNQAGGVAYVGSFTWGGYPGTPCWIFENMLSYSSKNMAEAAAHEVGHTLSLYHQSTYNSACTKTAEYNPGLGNGATSWAPIMGVGYSKNVTIWHNGTNANGCNVYQFDHGNGSPGITGGQFLSFLPDDIGNTAAAGKILNLTTLTTADSGLINTPTDIDVFRFTICNNRYVTINAKPWALDTNAGSYSGANLDVKVKLYNASGALIAGDSTISRLNALIGANLTAGTYFFSVDGDASANYTDYGSIGKYYLAVKATNPPQLANSITTPSSVCAGQSITLTYTSNGTPNSWLWNITGPASGSFAVANPGFSFNGAGIYTLSLLATGSSSSGCTTTRTLDVGNPPSLSIAGTSTVLCPQKFASLSASGATSYTWLPGNSNNSAILVTPSVTTTYTLIGSNGSCYSNVVSTLSVTPNFTFSVSGSANSICAGSQLTITANGVSSYTVNPGSVPGNPAVVSPATNTTFTITGTNNGCQKNAYLPITVTNGFKFTVTASDTFVCVLQPLVLSSSGGVSYTVNPGSLTGSQVTVTPAGMTTYTISSINTAQCHSDTTMTIYMNNCDYTGLSKQASIATSYKIYPNPATTGFTVEGPGRRLRVDVYSSLGALIYSHEYDAENPAQVNTSDWKKGLYFVRVKSDGEDLPQGKIIIQ